MPAKGIQGDETDELVKLPETDDIRIEPQIEESDPDDDDGEQAEEDEDAGDDEEQE
jgi:hypothetical protein